MPSGVYKRKLIYGVGINDMPGESSTDNKHNGGHDAWHAVIQRCYSPVEHIRRPTYKGCTVCPEWLVLSNFKEWYDINYHEGWQLDKDILIKGNKVYRPEACRFVPPYINGLLVGTTKGGRSNGLPVGVWFDKRSRVNPYYAQCKDGHNRLLSGPRRPTIALAKADYARLKTEIVRQQAKRGVADGMGLDVYYALIARGWHEDAT